jgi:hypothetical protein
MVWPKVITLSGGAHCTTYMNFLLRTFVSTIHSPKSQKWNFTLVVVYTYTIFYRLKISKNFKILSVRVKPKS